MPDIALKVENLSNCFRIGLKEELYDSLIGKVSSLIKSPFSNFKRLQKLSHFGNEQDLEDIIWALWYVAFEVKHGEVLGIVGVNAAKMQRLL